MGLGGTHVAEAIFAPLTFCHIARPEQVAEVSGHYHPKARVATRGKTIIRPAFLADERRIIMPAYGTYTGGMYCDREPIASLMGAGALAVLTGDVARPIPMPR